eukprot:COSAG01_NODE_28327_length_663_cov_3.131206_1_plen_74_part_10
MAMALAHAEHDEDAAVIVAQGRLALARRLAEEGDHEAARIAFASVRNVQVRRLMILLRSRPSDANTERHAQASR